MEKVPDMLLPKLCERCYVVHQDEDDDNSCR
jgi:hypothetical protein